MMDLKRKYIIFRYKHPKMKLVVSFGKALKEIVRMLSIVVSILTLYISVRTYSITQESLEMSQQSSEVSEQSLGVSQESLTTSKRALEISELALKTSSLNTEPIFEVKVDYKTDKLSIKHETYEIFKMKYVRFGKVRTIAVMNHDSDISGIELQEKYGEKPLTEGRSKNVGGCTEEEAREYNKELEISLDLDHMNEETLLIDKLEEKIKKECEKNENIRYWEVSPDFNYYYVEIVYTDAQGNLGSVYYVYKKEYMTDWGTYKITREEYKRYIKDVSEYNEEDGDIINKIFNYRNFKRFEDSKYDEFWEWFNLRQFE